MFSRISRRVFGIALVLTLAVSIPFGIVLANHFSDVPNSNPFHADIQALADTGVTTGCGGGRFCPSDFVTREQMAAFMNRLGALAPGKIPVVNADRLDGLHANGLTRAGLAIGSTIANTLTTAHQTSATLTMNASTAGFVVISGSAVSANFGGAGCPCLVEAQIRHVGTGATSHQAYSTMGNASIADYSSLSLAHVFGVAAGDHQFVLETRVFPGLEGAGTVGTFDAELTGLFSPFGSSGGGTLGVDSDLPTSDDQTTPGLPD